MFFAPSKSGQRVKIWIISVSKTSYHIQIYTYIPNPSQELPASSKAPNEELEDMDVLCTFKIRIESQNSYNGCIKDEWPYPNQDQDAKPQSGISIVSQSYDYGSIKYQWTYPNQDVMSVPNLRQGKYLIKAGLLWANLRQTKYLIKLSFSEPIPARLNWSAQASAWADP